MTSMKNTCRQSYRETIASGLIALIVLWPVAWGAPPDKTKEPEKKAKGLYSNDFQRLGTTIDPLTPTNRCFRIGKLILPVDQLPKGKPLVARMRVYCEVWGSPPEWDPTGPGRLQLDVTSKKGNRRISQCEFPVGKKWVTVELHFSVSPGTASVMIYNKWTRKPVLLDDLTIELKG